MSAAQVYESVMMRDLRPEDLPFIYSSWLRSYRNGAGKAVDGSAYWPCQHDLIERLLAKSRVVVACAMNEPDEVLGYVVFERIVDAVIVHWCYVKSPFRRLGVASAMVHLACSTGPTQQVQYTHKPKKTGGSHGLIRKTGAVLNTYLAR